MEKAGKWLETLNRLKPSVKTPGYQNWAFAHVEKKAELMLLDYRIGTGKEWSKREDVKPYLALIDRRLELSEKLWREVYGFGILRHIFIPDRVLPEWYFNYKKLFPDQEGNIRPGAAMSSEA